jgi:hypothetical protein
MKKKDSFESIIRKIVSENQWLSGMADFTEGDPSGIVEAKRFHKVSVVNDLDTLYHELLNWEGTFRYKNLLFFKHWQYGTFVYDIKKPGTYIEHLSVSVMPKERFKELVQELVNDKGGLK